MKQHLSSEQIARCVIGEQGPDEVRHLSECESCRTELEDLGRGLLLYRDSARNWGEHWMSKTDFQPKAVRKRPFLPRAIAGGLATAALAGLLLIRQADPPVQKEAPFVAIPFVVPAAVYERVRVVRMEVPVAGLRSVGIAIPSLNVEAAVSADVLVGQDGRALAVRLVHDSDFNLQRRYN